MREKSLKIVGIDFLLTQIGKDKLLLQANVDIKQALTIPQIAQAILNNGFPQIDNIVASESEILIYCKIKDHAKLIKSLEKFEVDEKLTKQKQLKLDVCFELGLDWERVCEQVGLDKEEIITEILKGKYPLINYGFQPGFMYLDALKEELHVPRLENPRLGVPAGSLAIGGKYLGVYGSASPGGWNIIGQTFHIYHKENSVDDLPQIGQLIKLNRITEEKFLTLKNQE